MSSSFRFVPLSFIVLACEFALFPCSVRGQSQVEDSSSKLIEPALLLEKPPAIPGHLRELFDRMEAANRRSQDVFRKLSKEQMNFKPSNGTHTPRWNAEHMAGRQLLFFSQIYNALDPKIPVLNWNPAQMPPNYKARHPEWSGKEEARSMQRVDDFCRRYAYLLEQTELDAKPPATSWPSLKALLLQMERHYGEHTANVVKKFELPEWPQE
ncbi:MAG: DinB family protein [Pirellulaceae bacterium]